MFCRYAEERGDLLNVWKLIVGFIFIVVIVALPNGIAPLVEAAWRRVVHARGAAGSDRQRRARRSAGRVRVNGDI